MGFHQNAMFPFASLRWTLIVAGYSKVLRFWTSIRVENQFGLKKKTRDVKQINPNRKIKFQFKIIIPVWNFLFLRQFIWIFWLKRLKDDWFDITILLVSQNFTYILKIFNFLNVNWIEASPISYGWHINVICILKLKLNSTPNSQSVPYSHTMPNFDD